MGFKFSVGVLGEVIGVVVLMEDSRSCVGVHATAKNVTVNRTLSRHFLLCDR